MADWSEWELAEAALEWIEEEEAQAMTDDQAQPAPPTEREEREEMMRKALIEAYKEGHDHVGPRCIDRDDSRYWEDLKDEARIHADETLKRLRTHSPEEPHVSVSMSSEGERCVGVYVGDLHFAVCVEPDLSGGVVVWRGEDAIVGEDFEAGSTEEEEAEAWPRANNGHLSLCSGGGSPPTVCGVCGKHSDDRHDAAWAHSVYTGHNRLLEDFNAQAESGIGDFHEWVESLLASPEDGAAHALR